MASQTLTGQLSAATAFTVNIAAADPNIVTSHRMCQITNSGGGQINVAWAKETVPDPPVGTGTDGQWRTNTFAVGDTAGSSITFKIPNSPTQVKLVSPNSPRFTVTVYDDLI